MVTVASGQTLANQTVAVTQGAHLQIRLADPGRLISAADDIMIGVYLPSGFFHPMRQAGRDAGGRTYDVAVPRNTPVRVAIVSTHLQMIDDHGAGLGPRATTQPASVATSTVLTMPGPSVVNGPPITFTVTGRK